MSPELFSRRHNLRGASDNLFYDYIPIKALIGFSYIFHEYINYVNDTKIIKEYCEIMRIPHDICSSIIARDKSQRIKYLESCLETPDWWVFLDICELISLSFYTNHPTKRGEYSNKLNTLFREENIGYEMQEGKIERIGNEFIDEKIKNARRLLKEPEFKSADELFEKSIKELNIRPKPDVENCVKDAIASVESIGRIIRKDKNARIDNIIKDGVQNGVVPRLLGDPIIKLYAYRGDEPAVAHGGIEPSKVTRDEAEFVLVMSAAIIIYLVKKRSAL